MDKHDAGAPPVERAVVPVKERYGSIEAVIRGREADIVAVLARGLDRDRFLALALAAISRQPELLDCHPASFVLALREAAELGLYPSGLMATGYLVPYRNKKTGRREVKFIPGYRGLIELARNSGELRTIEARPVRERDTFHITYGTDASVIHQPYIRGRDGDEDPGVYQGVWFRAALKHGDEHLDFMSTAEVEDVRRRSKAASDGPWVTDWPMMARKTIVRRNYRFLPLSAELQRALELEEVAESEAEPVVKATPSEALRRLRSHAVGPDATDEEAAAPEPPDGPVEGAGDELDAIAESLP